MELETAIQIGGIVGGIMAGTGFTLKFCKRTPVGDTCQDISCHKNVKQHGRDISEMKHNINDDIFPKINRTAEDVAYIKGRIDEALKARAL